MLIIDFMKKRLRIKYPKLLILILTFVLAYILFMGREYFIFYGYLHKLGYFGIFILGMFFAYGFTAAPATALMLAIAKDHNLIIAGFFGGLGALISDLIIFSFIRSEFRDEILKFKKEKFVMDFYVKLNPVFREYFLPVLSGFIIASPLPDEIGVILLASSFKISTRIFALISFLLNTAGILIIFTIGSLI